MQCADGREHLIDIFLPQRYALYSHVSVFSGLDTHLRNRV